MKATFKLPYIYLSRVHSVQIPAFKNILPFLLTIPVSESLIPPDLLTYPGVSVPFLGSDLMYSQPLKKVN